MKLLLIPVLLLSALCIQAIPRDSSVPRATERKYSADMSLESHEKRLAELRADMRLARDAQSRKHIQEMIDEENTYINSIKNEGGMMHTRETMHHPVHVN